MTPYQTRRKEAWHEFSVGLEGGSEEDRQWMGAAFYIGFDKGVQAMIEHPDEVDAEYDEYEKDVMERIGR